MFNFGYMRRFFVICYLWNAGWMGNLSAQVTDANEDIRGPKPLVEIPVPQQSDLVFWSYIIGGLLLLALAIYLWEKYSRKEALKNPSEVAFAALADLEKTGDSIAAEAFANRAAQTIRQYIAERFGLAAPRRTTEEFLRDLTEDKASALACESDSLRIFLKACDLAKFAESNLTATQRSELIQAARGFVRSTSNTVSS